VHVLFSRKPYPPDLDTAQLDGVRAYETELAPLGLIGYSRTTRHWPTSSCAAWCPTWTSSSAVSAAPAPSPGARCCEPPSRDEAARSGVQTLPDGAPVLLLNSNSLVTLGPGDGWSYPIRQPVSPGSEVRVRLEWKEPPSAAPLQSDLQLQLP
jgi:hypothetical protein